MPDDAKGDKRKMPLVCHFCGEVGHKAGNSFDKFAFFFCLKNCCAAQCPKIPSESKDIYRTPAEGGSAPQTPRDRNNLRPLEEVTCYRVSLRNN